MSSTPIFEAYVYDFFFLFGKVDLLSFDFERANRFVFEVLGTVGEFLIKCDVMH